MSATDAGRQNFIAQAISTTYGYVPLTVRHKAALAAMRVVDEWWNGAEEVARRDANDVRGMKGSR